MEQLETKLAQLQTELAAYFAKAEAQKAEAGRMSDETIETIRKIQTQVDAIDLKMQDAYSAARKAGPPLETVLREHSDVQALIKSHRGRARVDFEGLGVQDLFSQKTVTAAGLGWSTTGVMPEEREGGIVMMPRPQLRMRNVIPARATSLGKIAWISESARPTKASLVEANYQKPASDVSLTTNYEMVRTIALCCVATNQVLEDYTELLGFLRGEFAARVREEEDRQILFGDATGENLNGLTVQAQAWDLSLLTASDGYEYVDIISGAMQQIAEDDENTSQQFVVLHPGDWWKIRRCKDTTGRYILGDPQSPVAPTLWGAPVVDTTVLTKGKFLVGSGSPECAEIRDRMGVTIDLSTEDGDNFRYNRVTIRAEERVALVVKRPDAFVYGSLTQSPA